MYRSAPTCVAHDLHPDYASTRWLDDVAAREDAPAWARDLVTLPRVAVQHHHAHLAACLAEHGEPGPALGVTWDGTGYGMDGTIWGGEFLLGDASGYERVAALRPFRLPGGDAAAREPRRAALALTWPLLGEGAWETWSGRTFDPAVRPVLAAMVARGVRAPWTSSAGRLFDGVAALVGLHPTAAFEAQAAMALEAAAGTVSARPYPLPLREGDGRIELDWAPLVEALLDDVARGAVVSEMAARFHEALVEGDRRGGATDRRRDGGAHRRLLPESASGRDGPRPARGCGIPCAGVTSRCLPATAGSASARSRWRPPSATGDVAHVSGRTGAGGGPLARCPGHVHGARPLRRHHQAGLPRLRARGRGRRLRPRPRGLRPLEDRRGRGRADPRPAQRRRGPSRSWTARTRRREARRRVPRGGRRTSDGRRHRRGGDPAVDRDGDLRRPDPHPHPGRDRPPAPRRRDARARSGMSRLRDAAGADRQGDVRWRAATT